MLSCALLQSGLLAVGIVLGGGQPLWDQTVNHEDSGIELALPADWVYFSEEDRLLAESTALKLKLLVIRSELQVVESFTPALQQELSAVIELPEVDLESGLTTVEDLLQFRAQGMGLYQGELTEWAMAFVAGARKSAVVLILGDVSAHWDVIGGIFDSIRIAQLETAPVVD